MPSAMPSGRKLDADFMFTKLFVHDLERAAVFYPAVFGLIEMHRLDARIAGRPVREIVYMPTHSEGPMFILAKFEDRPKPAHDEAILGFSTRDMDALLARVAEAGGRLLELIPASPESPFRTAFVEDFEGHLLQISQAVG